MLDGGADVEIDGQAGADGAAGVGEPDHVVAGGEAGDVADDDGVAEAVGDVGEADRRAAVAIIPDAAMVGSAAPADAGNGAVRPGDRGGGGFAAAAAAVVSAGGADAVADGVGEDEAVAKTAEVAARARVRARLAGVMPPTQAGKVRCAAAVVAGAVGNSAVAQKAEAERVAGAGEGGNLGVVDVLQAVAADVGIELDRVEEGFLLDIGEHEGEPAPAGAERAGGGAAALAR